MKILSAAKGLAVFSLICFLFTGWLQAGTSLAQQNNQPEPDKDTPAASTAAATKEKFDPNAFTFNNLSEAKRAQVEKKISEERSQANILPQEEIADKLTLQFREKQENIRLYEVILLTVMSLCALGIVLKCMKDSKVCSARDMINGTGLVLVIFSTVMVIIIADVEIQLTAAMGVLGGIAGYLFGTLRTSHPADKEKIPEETQSKKTA